MHHAFLVDLARGGCHSCFGAALSDRRMWNSHVFLLYAAGSARDNDAVATLRAKAESVSVLDDVPVAAALYRFKRRADELDLSAVTVVTSARGKEAMERYRERLFTEVYAFEYDVNETCSNHAPSEPAAEKIRAEVDAFVRQLPALRGEITVNRSTLIPDCFGHGFSSRAGGVSYVSSLSSLNLFCSSKRRDPRAVVEENRRRLALAAGFYPRTMHFPKVNHASDVWVLGKPEPDSYDGLVTDRVGPVLVAPGADCIPLLFSDPVHRAIGATHAGWRGTLMGVAMATVDCMAREFGSDVGDVRVALGPSVGVCCYTMDPDTASDFMKIHPDCVPDPESSRPHVNIRLANRLLLQEGGVLAEHIHDDTVLDRPGVTPCTSCNPHRFFSHSRDGANFGTQAGFIWIRESGAEAEQRCAPE